MTSRVMMYLEVSRELLLCCIRPELFVCWDDSLVGLEKREGLA